MDDAIEAGGDQLAERANVTKIAREELDSPRRASKPLGIEVINGNVVLFGQELVDDVRTQKTRTAKN
jgi:hypothetical protein